MDNSHNQPVIRKDKFLREQVYRKLRESILNIALEPNKRLIEEKLAAEMGTSRTPVREAIQKLEKEGLIHKLPRGGFAVNVITNEDIEEVFGIRSVLEGYAAYLATTRATDDDLRLLENIVKKQEECIDQAETDEIVRLNTEFHDILYKSAKSKKLYTIINDLRDFIYRYRILVLRYEGMASIAIQDHKDMIAQMKARNARRVEKLVRKHIVRGMGLIKKKIRQEAQKKNREE
ncbi:MAG: GntR family transcriptional regulator [Syntrophorhabdus aromaticivorans]|uniref:GntR family transcriptional regulator n=1 Tax=Syntrophorhabdus aromaticivorans TaxID=328301 RepID=A0A971M7V9_9BACT|nr:GntR family transcriptional regulator [Syntrophorhabdus aromaticivorans]